MLLPNGIDNESGFIEVEIKLHRHKLVKEIKQMIYIVPDSNFLHISYDKSRATSYSRFCLNQPFEELINLRDLDTCNDIVQILVPEMVLRELVEQKITQYEKDIVAYNMLALRMDKPKEEFESVSSYRNEALKQAKEFLNTKSVNLIPVCDAMYWNRIIDKAIRKEAPFEGREGKADKGFKDTVIFFSMIEYARKNKGSYYFISKDGIFGGKVKNGGVNRLHQEFFDWSGSSFHVVADIDELKRRIVRIEPEQILKKLDYIMKAEEIRIDQDPTKVPIEIIQEIPVFTEDNVVGSMINEEITFQWQKFMKSWYEYPMERYPDEDGMVYEGSFIVEVTHNTKNKISVHFHAYQFVGGAHGGSAIYAYTYDLKEGKQLALTEVLKMGVESILKLVNQCINNDIKSSEAGKYYEEEVDIKDIENIEFYILDGEVHIVFNEYELGPYASGIIDLILCDCK